MDQIKIYEKYVQPYNKFSIKKIVCVMEMSIELVSWACLKHANHMNIESGLVRSKNILHIYF